MTIQFIHGGNPNSNLPTVNGSTAYNLLMGSGLAWSSGEESARELIPTSGALGKITVRASVGPGTGVTWTFFIVKNGVADHTTDVTLPNGSTYNTGVGTTSVVAGDTVTVGCTVSGGTATAAIATWFMRWVPTIDDENIYIGGSSALLNNTNVNTYNSLYGPQSGWNTNNSYVFTPTALDGTWKKLCVWLSDSPGGAEGDYYDFNLYDSGVIGHFTLTFTDSESGFKQDITSTRATTAGDFVCLQCISSGSPVNTPYALWGIVFVPDTSGSYMVMHSKAETLSLVNSQYLPALGEGVYSVSSALTQYIFPSVSIDNVYFKLVASTGGVYTFSVIDDLDYTDMIVEITTPDTLGSYTTPIIPTELSMINVLSTPSASPTSARAVGYCFACTYSAPTPPSSFGIIAYGTLTTL